MKQKKPKRNKSGKGANGKHKTFANPTSPKAAAHRMISKAHSLMLDEAEALRNKREFGGAEPLVDKVLTSNPDNFRAITIKGLILRDTARPEESRALLERALDMEPGNGSVMLNLGICYAYLRMSDEAAVMFHQIIDGDSEAYSDLMKSDACVNMANIYIQTGRILISGTYYYRALSFNPRGFYGQLGLSTWLTAEGRQEEAIALLKRLASTFPEHRELPAHLGQAQMANQDYRDAIENLQKGLENTPDNPTIMQNLAGAMYNTGRLKEGEETILKAIDIAPQNDDFWSFYIFNSDFSPQLTVEGAQAMRKEFNDRHVRPLMANIKPHTNDPDPDRKIRIGYVSADFKRHSAAHVFGSVIFEHDTSRFHTTCYYNDTKIDPMTQRFMDSSDEWRVIEALNHEQLAQTIRDDKIDILVDLSGHSAGHRLLTFAQKPAPVQVSAFGYVSGTGVETMDYLFTDKVLVPPEEQQYYQEEIYYLPTTLFYDPLGDLPDLMDVPALKRGNITFGCFNRSMRVSVETLAIYAVIMNAVPNSHMIFKGDFDAFEVQTRIVSIMEERGVGRERLTFWPHTKWADHMATIRGVDIMLDPIPHGGGITVIDPLVMGVPVVSLKGHVMTHRIGASILTATGMAEWAANDVREYRDIAVNLASDMDYLVKRRAELRDMVFSSPIGNAKKFVAAAESAYKEIWKRWCESQ